MSGFANAVVGGAETLIRSAIKSVNYVAGLTGWRISRDGDAEFNDVDIRGTLRLDGNQDDYVAIVAEFNHPIIELGPEVDPGISYTEPARISGTRAFTPTPGVYAPMLSLTSPEEATESETAEIRIFSEETDGINGPSVDMFGSAGRFTLDVEGEINATGLINSGYVYQGTQYFTANGTFQQSAWPAGKACRVKAVGGGGGAGGAGATAAGQWSHGDGGGAGEYAEGFFLFSGLPLNTAITIGAGGAGGAGGASGTNGGNTSFGLSMSANGGGGGNFRNAGTGVGNYSGNTNSRAGGTGGTGGDIRWRGGAGGSGQAFATGGGFVRGGDGGMSNLSGSVVGASDATGVAGSTYGGGGSGASNAGGQAARSGGAGADGIVIVEVYG